MSWIERLKAGKHSPAPIQSLSMANNNHNYDIDHEAADADVKEKDIVKFKQLEVKESQEIPYLVNQDQGFAKRDCPQEEC